MNFLINVLLLPVRLLLLPLYIIGFVLKLLAGISIGILTAIAVIVGVVVLGGILLPGIVVGGIIFFLLPIGLLVGLALLVPALGQGIMSGIRKL